MCTRACTRNGPRRFPGTHAGWTNLGSYTDLPLAAARQSAKELRAKIALGHDVAGEKQERKSTALARIEAARSVTTVGQLADEYFERMINGRWKHPNIVRGRIEKDIKPHLGKLALDAVEPRHIDAMLRAVVKRGAPTIANDVLRWVRRMFDYAIKRHLVRFNPTAAFDLADAGGKEPEIDDAVISLPRIKLTLPPDLREFVDRRVALDGLCQRRRVHAPADSHRRHGAARPSTPWTGWRFARRGAATCQTVARAETSSADRSLDADYRSVTFRLTSRRSIPKMTER